MVQLARVRTAALSPQAAAAAVARQEQAEVGVQAGLAQHAAQLRHGRVERLAVLVQVVEAVDDSEAAVAGGGESRRSRAVRCGGGRFEDDGFDGPRSARSTGRTSGGRAA